MNAATGGGKFALGARVFAKMKGFPSWPAQIVESSEAYPKAKPSKYKKQQFVRFYKTNDVAWVAEADLESFDEKVDEYRQMAAAKAGRQSYDLRQAIADAEADIDGIDRSARPERDASHAVGETTSYASSQTPLDSKPEHPDNALTIDADASPVSKLAPVRAMQELAPNTSSVVPAGSASEPNHRITITLGKDSAGKGLQTVTTSGGAAQVLTKGLPKRGDKRTLAATDTSPPSTTGASAVGTPKRAKGVTGGNEKTVTRGKSAVKSPPQTDSVWVQSNAAQGTETLRTSTTRALPRSIAAEHQTGVTARYGFFGLASDALLSSVAEKIVSAGNKKVTVNVYMPTSFDQQHARRGTRSATHEVKDVDVLFNESEVVFLAPPTEADLKNLFEGEETHRLRRCVKAGTATKAVVLFGLFDPFLVKHVADLMGGKQVEVLELAPVGGNAAQGDMVFCASGSTDVLRRIGEFFNAAGRTVVNLGSTVGAAVKLAGLYSTFEAVTTAALVEVLHDAKHLEVNPARLLELIATQGAASTTCTSQAHQCMSDPPGMVQSVTRSLDERLNVMRRMLAPFRAQEFMLSQAHCVIRNMFAAFRPEKAATTVSRYPSQQQPPQSVSNVPNQQVVVASQSVSTPETKPQNSNGAATKSEHVVTATATAAPAVSVNRPTPQHKHGTRAAAAANTNGNSNVNDAPSGSAGNGGGSTSSASSSIVSSSGGTTSKAPGGEHRGRGRPRKTPQQPTAHETATPRPTTTVAPVATADQQPAESSTVQQGNDTLDSDVFDMTTMDDADADGADVAAGRSVDESLGLTGRTDDAAAVSTSYANGVESSRGGEKTAASVVSKQVVDPVDHDGSVSDAASTSYAGRQADSGEPDAKRQRSGHSGARNADVGGGRNKNAPDGSAAAVPPVSTAAATRRSPHHTAVLANTENAHLASNSTAGNTKNVSNDAMKQHRTNSNGHNAVNNTTTSSMQQKTMREPNDKRVNSGIAVNSGGTLSGIPQQHNSNH